MAELRERQLGGGAGQRQRITYLHRDMEHTGLPDASCDVVSVQFVTHECPAHIIRSLVGGRVGGRVRGWVVGGWETLWRVFPVWEEHRVRAVCWWGIRGLSELGGGGGLCLRWGFIEGVRGGVHR